VSGFPDRGLEDGDVLLDGAAAYADAGNHLAPTRERRSTSHRAITALGHQWEQRLPGLHQRKKVGAPVIWCWRMVLPCVSITQTATRSEVRDASVSTRSAIVFANASKSMTGDPSGNCQPSDDRGT
jgi:hypothetical protein